MLFTPRSTSVKRQRCAQWNSGSEMTTKQKIRESGFDSRVWSLVNSRASSGIHPSGQAIPVRNIRTGMRKAATTPPAENKDHQIGSLDFAMFNSQKPDS